MRLIDLKHKLNSLWSGPAITVCTPAIQVNAKPMFLVWAESLFFLLCQVFRKPERSPFLVLPSTKIADLLHMYAKAN